MHTKKRKIHKKLSKMQTKKHLKTSKNEWKKSIHVYLKVLHNSNNHLQ